MPLMHWPATQCAEREESRKWWPPNRIFLPLPLQYRVVSKFNRRLFDMDPEQQLLLNNLSARLSENIEYQQKYKSRKKVGRIFNKYF